MNSPVNIATLKKGDRFEILHVDGKMVEETVSSKSWWQNQYWVVCESAACYRQFDFNTTTSTLL